MLTGDLNDLQQMALISLMTEETDESRDRVLTLLRSMVIAVHGDPKKTIEMLDEGPPSSDDEIPEFAPEMSEEEMEEYEHYSEEEVAQTIDLLRKFGVAVS